MAAAALAIVLGVTASSLVGAAATTPHRTPAVQVAHKTVSYKINATYSGTISILWNASGPTVASISGTGKGAEFGLSKVSGSGKVTASAQSDPINGTGVLVGKKESLHLKIATGTTATAASSQAPTVVTISGSAVVVKGTGKFAGAKGTLKVSGEFSIQSTSGKESDSFSATLKGTIKVTEKK